MTRLELGVVLEHDRVPFGVRGIGYDDPRAGAGTKAPTRHCRSAGCAHAARLRAALIRSTCTRSESLPTTAKVSRPTSRRAAFRFSSRDCRAADRWDAPLNSPHTPASTSSRSTTARSRPARSRTSRFISGRGNRATPSHTCSMSDSRGDRHSPHARSRAYAATAGSRRPPATARTRSRSTTPAASAMSTMTPASRAVTARRISWTSACSAGTHGTPYLITAAGNGTRVRSTSTPRPRILPVWGSSTGTGSGVERSRSRPSK